VAELGLRLAELLAAVSLATDLAHGLPFESALRDALLALGLAKLVGLPETAVSDVYYLALLYHIGCTGAAELQSRLGAGDDVSVRRWLSEADYADRPELMRIAATQVAQEWPRMERTKSLMDFMVGGQVIIDNVFASIAEVARRLSQRLGANARVTAALDHVYARWDGKVFPSLPCGEELALSARLVHLVQSPRSTTRLADAKSPTPSSPRDAVANSIRTWPACGSTIAVISWRRCPAATQSGSRRWPRNRPPGTSLRDRTLTK
jgi:hypothetical protein